MPKIVKNSKGIAKPKNILKTIKRIFVYMFNFKIQLFIVFIGIISLISAHFFNNSSLELHLKAFFPNNLWKSYITDGLTTIG